MVKQQASKVLLSMYDGPCDVLRPIALPSLEAYAERHSYDLVLVDAVEGLPSAWGKVAALRDALSTYDFAAWIDGDAVLLTEAPDCSNLPVGAFQAFVPDRRLILDINTWFWAIRSTEIAKEFLDLVWDWRASFLTQPWDLGGVHEVLLSDTSFQVGTVLLDSTWGPVDSSALRHASHQHGDYRERAQYLADQLLADGEVVGPQKGAARQ